MATPRNARPGMLLDSGAPINRGLVGWWPMWEGAGGKALDISGKSNHGTLTNEPKWAGNGILFDGVNDYINCGGMGDFSTNLTLASVALEIQTSSTAIQNVFGTINTSTGQAFYSLRINFNPSTGANETGKMSYYIRSNTNNHLIVGVDLDTGISNGKPHHVVCTHNKAAGTGAIYIDGVPQTITYPVANTGTAWVAWNNPFYIGQIANIAGDVTKGIIKNFRLWQRQLSAMEVKYLYGNPNAGLWVSDITRYYVAVAGGGAKLYYLGGNAANRGQRGMGWAA